MLISLLCPTISSGTKTTTIGQLCTMFDVDIHYANIIFIKKEQQRSKK